MWKLVAVYIALVIATGIAIHLMPEWAVTCLAIGGGALLFWFLLYINRHSE